MDCRKVVVSSQLGRGEWSVSWSSVVCVTGAQTDVVRYTEPLNFEGLFSVQDNLVNNPKGLVNDTEWRKVYRPWTVTGG